MEDNKPTTEHQELSFGQKLVGLNFNPSNDDKVGKAKQLFADAADMIHEEYMAKANTPFFNDLYLHAIGEILNAQMNVVKVLTLKY